MQNEYVNKQQKHKFFYFQLKKLEIFMSSAILIWNEFKIAKSKV